MRTDVTAMPRRFASTDDAWIATMAFLWARREGRAARDEVGTADAVVKRLDRLYREKRIELPEVRVLRIYGESGAPPDPQRDPADAAVWQRVLGLLDGPLRRLGIVAEPARPSASDYVALILAGKD